MARPAKHTDAAVTKLCQALQIGATYELACKYAGIRTQTLRNWLSAGEHAAPGTRARQVYEQVSAAEGVAAIGWLAKIEAAANEGTWQAAAWKLERRYPEQYGRQVLTYAGQVNLTASPEWQQMRTTILRALAAYPEARSALAEVLSHAHRNGTGA